MAKKIEIYVVLHSCGWDTIDEVIGVYVDKKEAKKILKECEKNSGWGGRIEKSELIING